MHWKPFAWQIPWASTVLLLWLKGWGSCQCIKPSEKSRWHDKFKPAKQKAKGCYFVLENLRTSDCNFRFKKKKRANFYKLSSQVWTEGDCTPSRAESFLDMFHRLSHNQTFMETPLNNLGYFTVLKLKLAFQLADEAFGFVRALLSTHVYSISLAGALCRQGKQWG